MKYPKLLIIAISVLVFLVAYALFRYLSRRNRTKYGFTIDSRGNTSATDLALTQQAVDAFVAENDSAIKDILSDYVNAHPSWEHVSSEKGQWRIRPKTGRKGDLDDCIIRCHTGPSYEDGRLQTTVDILIPRNLNERQVMQKALVKAIRRSRTGRKVRLVTNDQWA
jgi:hypothetical protein